MLSQTDFSARSYLFFDLSLFNSVWRFEHVISLVASASLCHQLIFCPVQRSRSDPVPWFGVYHRTKAAFGASKHVTILKDISSNLGPDHRFSSKTYDSKLKEVCDSIRGVR